MKTEIALSHSDREGDILSAEGQHSPSPRFTRWITLCDELSLALLEAAREALRQSTQPLDRVDALKEIVTVGHRLFTLERALAITPRLAGEQESTSNPAILAQRFEEFLRMTRDFRESSTSAEAKEETEANDLKLFPADAAGASTMFMHEP
ncbi:MAG: hypothetical protein ACPL7D_04530 [Candidatus Sumerlaeaceae bacterium]|jgi:hypothetical protein